MCLPPVWGRKERTFKYTCLGSAFKNMCAQRLQSTASLGKMGTLLPRVTKGKCFEYEERA